ncbi:MAG: exo-alpha-sialidase [Candidatus Hydrogenedentota bacterium]
MKSGVTAAHEEKVTALLKTLIDQEHARVLVPPYENTPGFWFGGGNLVRDDTGTLWLVGRYRNAGDSRTGLKMGERGLELAVFASQDDGATFKKVQNWSKKDLSRPGAEVLSLEGASLFFPQRGGCELYVSSEKRRPYPDEVKAFQKEGTGVWTIDVIRGDSPEALDSTTLSPVFAEQPDPGHLHVKDPVVFPGYDGATILVFCNHPFTWASANSGYAVRENAASPFEVKSWEFVSRGPAWDVAGTRMTSCMPVPGVGAFKGLAPVCVYFYDGLECVRPHEQSAGGVKRPRGYSCEELGGACWGPLDAFPEMTRLSQLQPLFVSPHGTGCSRYVETLVEPGGIRAIWQQGQEDGSQPLVINFLSREKITGILS